MRGRYQCKINMKEIPIYTIGSFTQNILFQVEPFDISRDFKVMYPHRHDNFFEVLFLTNGKGSHTIDFQQYEVKPNTIFFLSPGQIHELELSPDVKGYIFLFTSDFYHFNKTDTNKLFELPYFFHETIASPPLYLEAEEDKNIIENWFAKACDENIQNQPDKNEVIRAYLDLILIFCKRKYVHTFAADEKLQKGRLLVKKFKQLIEGKCVENLSIKQYATLLFVTPSHLSEVVKSVSGRTSTDLINDRMILEIKRLLKYSDLTITEIAYKLNFTDQSYFAKYVKKLSHFSPKELRNQLLAAMALT